MLRPERFQQSSGMWYGLGVILGFIFFMFTIFSIVTTRQAITTFYNYLTYYLFIASWNVLADPAVFLNILQQYLQLQFSIPLVNSLFRSYITNIILNQIISLAIINAIVISVGVIADIKPVSKIGVGFIVTGVVIGITLWFLLLVI
nr:hypothetical protein [Candidatus Freyarchaeota archaeon]